ncbi:MAG: bifunctional diguanylate cyclase/phosphodiesterase [Proteobacteria bacterium]|nr:bifunctional diguanylate cyclase/phosphodiesterase [Pseudomonadota bacterium]
MRSQALQAKPVDGIRALVAAQESERLRLALAGANLATFDWTIPDDRISWDGSTDTLSAHIDPDRLKRGERFKTWMSGAGREQLSRILEDCVLKDSAFAIEFEAASPMGTVWFEMCGVRMPGPDGRAERLAGVLHPVTEKKLEAQRLTYLATRDELTGHLNRTSLRTELAQTIEAAKSENRTCAYLVAAIDRLAMINEAYGFGAADEVIVTVGERLASKLRATDIIGRTAGNKLGVILGDCSEREIALVSDRLRAAVCDKVISTRNGTVSATISVGAVWLPSGASSSQEAMLRAEEALDRARAGGRGGYAVYTNSPQREMARLRLMAIADDVVAALHDHRLIFAYQPIVDATTRAVVHYECLLRMARTDGSIVSAGQFIPAAEQLGLVRLVDRHALEMTIAQLHANRDISLAVNVSGTTAGDPSWLESFVNYVRANREVAERVIVELTETAALNDFEESAAFVSKLREMGCRVAIDDFGAGYTSFRNLQMLHVDMVKIDGTFVHGISQSPDNQIFVRTLIDLAKNFDLKTVAEWVSSEEDARLLKSFGIDYFQGFFLGEPVVDPDWVKR